MCPLARTRRPTLHPVVSVRDCFPSRLVCSARPGWRRLDAILAMCSCFVLDFRPDLRHPARPHDLVRPDPTEQRAPRTRYTNLLVHTSPSLLFFTLSLHLHVRTRGPTLFPALLFPERGE